MSAYSDKVIADGAVAYWRLGETSGTVARSEVGSFDGTISGGVTLNQPGALSDGNTAMAFNGTTGAITIAAFNLPVAPVSIEGWFKSSMINGAGFQGRLAHATSGGTLYFLINSQNNGFIYSLDGGLIGTTLGAGHLNGQWHHIVYTNDGTTRIAVDGVQVGSGAQIYPATTGLALGTQFPGSIDEVAIYPTALTPAQIAGHYTAASSRFANWTAGWQYLAGQRS